MSAKSTPHPRASVVIPTYRRPEATVRAVRSALGQTIRDIEVIVVDDASGDGTAEAVEAIGDARIRVLRQTQNKGACDARNRGVAAACAEFIAFLDSDDELLPDSIEKRLAVLEARPDSPLVYSRVFYRLPSKVEVIGPEHLPGPEDPFVEALIVRQGLATSAMLTRAQAARACPFDPEVSGVDDWDVALKLARLGPVVYHEEPLTIIHAEDEEEGGRMTFGFRPKTEHLLLDRHREQFDACPRAEAVVLYKLAMRATRTGEHSTALGYLDRIGALDPNHRRARVIGRMIRLGLGPILPSLLRLRWKLMLATGRVK